MMRTTLPIITASLLALLLLVAACGDDPASPPDTPSGDTDLDVTAILTNYAAGEVHRYEAALHDEFRFVPPEDGTIRYARAQEIDLIQAMHDGEAGTDGVVLQGAELVRLEPIGDWIATDRDDPLGAHRLGARKRVYALTLRFALVDSAAAWEVGGHVVAFADTVDGDLRLLGLVDQTGDPDRSDAPSWSDVRRAWGEPILPSLPGTPDLLSMRWITAHDGRDWLRMGELLHSQFRYVSPEGEVRGRADELATFADLMAGRPSRNGPHVAQLDVHHWERMGGSWDPVGADDPYFGGVPGAVEQWMEIGIVYTTADGEEWSVNGLVRMAAVETGRGIQMLGFVDDSAETGEPGSVGWSEVRAECR